MIRSILVMALWWVALTLHAGTTVSPLVINDKTDKLSVVSHAIVMEDKRGDWTFEQVRALDVQAHRIDHGQNVPSFGFTESAYWMTFEVTSRARQTSDWLLVFNDALMGRIDLWMVSAEGEVTHQVSGADVPVAERPLQHRTHVFPLNLPAGESARIYLRVKSGLAIVLPVTWQSVSGFLEASNQETYYYALYFGIIIAMFMYNGFLYVSLRDPNYLWYVAFLASMFFYYGTFNGFSLHMMSWVPPNLIQEFFALTLILSGVTALVFAMAFIPLRGEQPLLYRLMTVNIVISLAGIAMLFFVPVMIPALIGTFCGMICAVLSIVAGFVSAKGGYVPARYFFAAWFSLCLSSVVFGFRTLSWIDSNAITDHIQQVGSAVEMILLSFALAARMRVMKKEKEDMQALAIQNMQKADQLKDEFLANTSHELRTPLNGIIGLAEASLHDGSRSLDPVTRDNIRMIISSGRRLASLVNDILDFSKLKHEDIVLSCRPVDVASLAEVVLTLSRPLIKGKPVVLMLDMPEGLPAVWADENRLQQILHNLVGNAIKFTHQGQVTVSASVRDDRVELMVGDTGIGIPQDRIAQVFESFNQGDGSIQREYGGTGLGLSITRKLVELHDGKIRATSTEGVGSCFSFDLPVARDAADMAVVSTRPIDVSGDVEQQVLTVRDAGVAVSASARRILVVDDEPLNREVLKAQLSSAGFAIEEAKDGDEALEKLRDAGASVDLVLLDVMMPRRSGLDTCVEIRKMFPALQLPVIFLTARSQSRDILAGFEAGGNDYLVKPFSRDELLARLRIHMELVTTHRLIRDYSKNLEQRVSDRTEALLQAQQQLVLEQKMAALGVMTAGVAHEINNPNNFVRAALQNVEAWRASFSEFISTLMDEDADQELTEAFASRFRALDGQLTLIEEGSRRIDTIVNGLRVVTRVDEADQKITTDVIEGLEATLQLLKSSFPAGVSVVQDFRVRQPVICFPAEINQVFMNVIMNALHAIEDRCVNGEVTGMIRVSSLDDQGRLVIRIVDDGIGMDAATLARACDPFFTTRTVGQGTGLGLSTSREIMRRQGGDLSLQSSPGQGCVVTLRFGLETAP